MASLKVSAPVGAFFVFKLKFGQNKDSCFLDNGLSLASYFFSVATKSDGNTIRQLAWIIINDLRAMPFSYSK